MSLLAVTLVAGVAALGVAASPEPQGRDPGSLRQPTARSGVPADGQQGDDYKDPTQHPSYYRAGPFLPGYDFTELPLDPDSVFYPSSATTKSGGFYPQRQLLDVERCGDAGCHPDIYGMWYESTHHLASFNDPWYRRTFEFIEERSGQKTAQWCGGCHDPAIMMTGNMQGRTPIDFDSAAANIGIGCQFCHSVGAVHSSHANGSYELYPAAELPYAGTDDPVLRQRGNRQLLESPELIRRHKTRRRSYFHSFSLFCGSCHKQSLITPVNNYKWLRGFDEFDGWQDSGISGTSARSFYYPTEPMVCQTCHMAEVGSDDAGNDGGLVNSHRFLGSNTALAAFHGYDDQLLETVKFLQEDRLRVDILGLRLSRQASGPDEVAASRLSEPDVMLIAPVDGFDVGVSAGTEIGIEVVVRTLGVGHPFPGGTVDSNMAWLELALLDPVGRPQLMSGGMRENRFVDPEAHSYRGVFLDEAGQELDKRNGWDRRAAVYVRMIPPGSADTIHYTFTVPENLDGSLTLRARLNYRKHKQAYNRWVFGAEPLLDQPAGAVSSAAVDTRSWSYDDSRVPELPIVVLATDEVTLQVVKGPAGTVVVDGAPVDGERLLLSETQRTRFNDYGIGLLRQSDLREAVRVFRWVQQMDPGYADGFVNEARARLEEGDLAAAATALQEALRIRPGWFKANYFMAQVDRGYGDYESAVERLERVALDYPYDRQVRVDLGRTYYVMGRYESAVPHLLWVLDNIDPEELGAHYNLMLSYRALGEDQKSEIHQSRYLRYREDEDIRRLTGPYRRQYPGANLEAQPIHLHRLRPADGSFSSADRFGHEEFLQGGRYARPATVFPGPKAPWMRLHEVDVDTRGGTTDGERGERP